MHDTDTIFCEDCGEHHAANEDCQAVADYIMWMEREEAMNGAMDDERLL